MAATRKRAPRARRPAPPRETPIQKAIVGLLISAGFRVVEHRQGARERAGKPIPLGAVMHVPGVGRIRGYPDLEVILPGRIVWLEVKRPELGRVSDVQSLWHRTVRALGHEVHVVNDPLEALRIVRAAAARAKGAA